jgi:hypothetical protein
MQADAEHQQHHADLGKLACNVDIRDKARRAGPDQDTRREVADERRHLQTRGHESEHQGKAERRCDRRDQRCGVGHRSRTPFGFRILSGPLSATPVRSS